DRQVITNRHFVYARQLEETIEDAYTRLLLPSIENESINLLKQQADEEAIAVFVANLKQLLLESPLGQKKIIAVDPGFRTGCKTTVIDAQGKLLEHFVIYPERTAEASAVMVKTCEKYRIEAIAVGNGTGGRETGDFLRKVIPASIPVISVNESGASIYSAGETARREFPELDLTFRSSVSIGRRLQDPLAELVKLDPKSIGVGQYQHDVDQDKLKKALDDAVTGCVNAVGVELNSASFELLTYVSGLGQKLAANVIEYRTTNGAFKSRAELKKVKGLGPKAFEQCAGFLRIRGASNPLDASGVHPERYELVKRMAGDYNCGVAELMKKVETGEKIEFQRYLDDSIGQLTMQDILRELARPGRDPRPEFQPFAFAENVHSIADLQPGMKLPGVVTNVTKFGAFVDIGVHNDGLLHISKMAQRFISDPQEVVSVHDRLTVTVVDIDRDRQRISLSLID
ncbi:MAG: helix-hairpin-helix domain-containing protein, partial [Victivallaceae bacterium]